MSVRLTYLISFGQRHTVMLLRIAAMIVLARLLTPAEIGVGVSALAIISLGLVLADFGARSYLIQAKEITRDRRRAAFGVSLIVSVLAAALVVGACLLAPAAIVPPETRTAVLVLSISLLVHPLSMTATAMLQRELRFGALYLVGVTSAAAAHAIAIVLAWRGVGYMSPIWGAVAEAVFTAGLTSIYCRPVRPSVSRPREVLSFGWVWTAIAALRECSEVAERLILSSLLGLAGVGLVSRSQAVVGLVDRLVMEGVAPVALPALAERVRSGQGLGEWFVHQFALLAAVCWPAFGFIALFAEPLVLLLLGDQWVRAVPLVQWLCLAGLFIPLSGLAVEFLVALGVVRSYLPRQLIVQTIKVAVIFGAALVSLEAACAAIALEGGIKAIAVYDLIRRYVRPSGRAMLGAFGHALAVSAAALSGPAVIAAMVHQGAIDRWPGFAAAACSGAVLWAAVTLLTRHPVGEEVRRMIRFVTARFTAAAA